MKNTDVASSMKISVRWVQKLYSRYRSSGNIPVLGTPGRPRRIVTEEMTKTVQAAFEKFKCCAVFLEKIFNALTIVSLFSENSRAFERTVNGNTLDFVFDDGKILDVQTNSEWNYDGLSVSGKNNGMQLERMPIEPGFWFEWVAFHPQTLVYDGV